jgi:hypothetical protein
MDRKTCVLFYSRNSQASTKLIAYIQQLPIDLPTLVGMTLVSADSDPVRQALLNNNIKNVPVLLIEYFSAPNTLPRKQQLTHDLIYQWIDEVVASVASVASVATTASGQLAAETQAVTLPDIEALESPRGLAGDEQDPSAGYKTTSKNRDIAAVAAEMAKFREQEDEKLNRKRREEFPLTRA